MARSPALKRAGILVLLAVPWLVGLSGLLRPGPAVLALVLLGGGAVGLWQLLLRRYGKGEIRGQFMTALGGADGRAAFVRNAAWFLLLPLAAWSTTFWGARLSALLVEALRRLPGAAPPEARFAWTGRNLAVWPLLVAALWHTLRATRAALGLPAEAGKAPGILPVLLATLSPAALAVLWFLSPPIPGIFGAVVLLVAVAAAVVLAGRGGDIGALVRHLWFGPKQRSGLALTTAFVTLLTAFASLVGRAATIRLFQQIDQWTARELSNQPFAQANIPLYALGGLLILLSLLLLNSRLARGGVSVSKAGSRLKMILHKKDGTVVYHAGKKSTIREEVAEIIRRGVSMGASDVHLEPAPDGLHIRYRVDGLLTPGEAYPQEVVKPAISSLKVMSDMDIAERRRPQDGRFSGWVEDHAIDFRVSTTPMSYGEKMVIRILDQTEGVLGLDQIGFTPGQLRDWRTVIRRPHGIVIVCGPTGSGKTTTIYSTVQKLDVDHLNVVTIEEPIEYKLAGVTQTTINEKAGITFAKVLRSTLRQDPDVIFLGEIRDAETAKVAMQASLTGHMVLTTVHATDVCSCLLRLMDLGVNDKNIISFSAILSQRLVRTLCPNCKEPGPPTEEELEILEGLEPAPGTLHHPVGCPHCADTGFHGRRGIFELLVVKDSIRDLFLTDVTPGEIRKKLIADGFKPMWHQAVDLVLKGETTAEEISRVAVRE
jgi:general secretion pathway protein E